MTVLQIIALVPGFSFVWMAMRSSIKILRGETIDRNRTAVGSAALAGLFVGLSTGNAEAAFGPPLTNGGLMFVLVYVLMRMSFRLMDFQRVIWRRMTRK